MDVSELLDDALSRSTQRTLQEAFEVELNRSGLTRTQVERLLKIERRTLIAILEGKGKTHDVTQVLKVGAFCGLDISQTMAMYVSILPKEKIGEIHQSVDLARLNSLFELKSLKAIGFVDSDKDLATITSRVKQFFGISSLSEYDSLVHNTLFSKTKRKSRSEKMLDFWTTSSIRYFESINNPHPYDRKLLLGLIPKIKAQSQNVESGLLNVARALFAAGVTVVFQQKIPNTNIKGATFLLDESPCIVLTDHGRSYPRLWFSLIHELHHVLYDLDSIRDWTFHLTGEPNIQLLQEEKADRFAHDMLCSDEKLDTLGLLIHNPSIVAQKARKWGVHPSIVYASFQFREAQRGENFWGAFRKQFPDFDLAVKNFNASIWKASSIEDAAVEARSLLDEPAYTRAPEEAEDVIATAPPAGSKRKTNTISKNKKS